MTLGTIRNRPTDLDECTKHFKQTPARDNEVAGRGRLTTCPTSAEPSRRGCASREPRLSIGVQVTQCRIGNEVAGTRLQLQEKREQHRSFVRRNNTHLNQHDSVSDIGKTDSLEQCILLFELRRKGRHHKVRRRRGMKAIGNSQHLMLRVRDHPPHGKRLIH